MKFKKLLAIGSALLLVAGFVSLGAGSSSATAPVDNTNEITYWETQYPSGTTCFKDTDAAPYGAVTDSGMTVTLAGSYDWVALIVKGGAVDYGDGPGNKVYSSPSSGTPYSPPLNNGGQQAAVSHWIVCINTTPPPVTTVPGVTFTDVCGVANDGFTSVVDTASIDYTITDSRVAGVGNVTVTAAPQSGYTFAAGAYTGPWSQEFTNEVCDEVKIAYLAPDAFDPTCPEELDAQRGYIQLDLKDHLHYTIDGVSTTQAKNELAPGTYTISVTVDPGFTLSGLESWEMTINPPFCPPTLALLSTTASMQNITCPAAGSYTLANTEGIQWLVNGVLTPAGTYTVADASTVNVEAQLVDSVNDGWEDGAQKTWTFNFTDPADCDLPTLAFTGTSGGNLGLLLAGGFLLFGGAIIAFERRFRLDAR